MDDTLMDTERRAQRGTETQRECLVLVKQVSQTPHRGHWTLADGVLWGILCPAEQHPWPRLRPTAVLPVPGVIAGSVPAPVRWLLDPKHAFLFYYTCGQLSHSLCLCSLFFIEFIGVSLVNTIIYISGVQLHETSSVYCMVLSTPSQVSFHHHLSPFTLLYLPHPLPSAHPHTVL